MSAGHSGSYGGASRSADCLEFLNSRGDGRFCSFQYFFDSSCVIVCWAIWGFRGSGTVEVDCPIVKICPTILACRVFNVFSLICPGSFKRM